MRSKVIFWGIMGAVILRILFSGIAQLLQVIGLTLAGGLLLLFVCWKMYRQIVDGAEGIRSKPSRGTSKKDVAPGKEVSFLSALWTIIPPTSRCRSTTCSRSRCGPAGEIDRRSHHRPCALDRAHGGRVELHRKAACAISWIAWIGLFIILYVALDMIYRDSHRVFCLTYASAARRRSGRASCTGSGLGLSGRRIWAQRPFSSTAKQGRQPRDPRAAGA